MYNVYVSMFYLGYQFQTNLSLKKRVWSMTACSTRRLQLLQLAAPVAWEAAIDLVGALIIILAAMLHIMSHPGINHSRQK